MNTRVFLQAIALGGAVVAATTVLAADPAAQAKIGQLEQRVLDLESRLQALESRFDQGVPVNKGLEVEAKPGGWRNADNWDLLARGMEPHEVERFLGEPDGVRSVSKFEYWSYGNGKATLYMNRLKSWVPPITAGD
jgi:outer membrane murein-binding lipoprotein Lpp